MDLGEIHGVEPELAKLSKGNVFTSSSETINMKLKSVLVVRKDCVPSLRRHTLIKRLCVKLLLASGTVIDWAGMS